MNLFREQALLGFGSFFFFPPFSFCEPFHFWNFGESLSYHTDGLFFFMRLFLDFRCVLMAPLLRGRHAYFIALVSFTPPPHFCNKPILALFCGFFFFYSRQLSLPGAVGVSDATHTSPDQSFNHSSSFSRPFPISSCLKLDIVELKIRHPPNFFFLSRNCA